MSKSTVKYKGKTYPKNKDSERGPYPKSAPKTVFKKYFGKAYGSGINKKNKTKKSKRNENQ